MSDLLQRCQDLKIQPPAPESSLRDTDELLIGIHRDSPLDPVTLDPGPSSRALLREVPGAASAHMHPWPTSTSSRARSGLTRHSSAASSTAARSSAVAAAASASASIAAPLSVNAAEGASSLHLPASIIARPNADPTPPSAGANSSKSAHVLLPSGHKTRGPSQALLLGLKGLLSHMRGLGEHDDIQDYSARRLRQLAKTLHASKAGNVNSQPTYAGALGPLTTSSAAATATGRVHPHVSDSRPKKASVYKGDYTRYPTELEDHFRYII